MNKKEKMQKDIEDALNHEAHLQYDDNEDPALMWIQMILNQLIMKAILNTIIMKNL